MKDSAYQRAIYSIFRNTTNNISVSAVAGSGKTTVLLRLLEYVPNGSRCLFLAFNNSIVNELRERNPRVGDPDINIMTIHSCGWRAILEKYGRKVKMNPNKVMGKIEYVAKRENIPENKKRYYFYIIPKIVDLMRCNVCDSNNLDEVNEMLMHYDIIADETDVAFALRVFKLMNADRSQFDFMDMIYVPVTDSGVRLMKYDYVLCDESQDFSTAQQLFIKRCIARSGRLVTVGDRRQAIYGFAGADAESYDNLCNVNGGAVNMPLSVSYRCAKRIVEEAQTIVPEIKYSPSAEEGWVGYGSLTQVQRGDWIVCRNLRPLVQTYMWLTKSRIKSRIRGVDIGEGIISLVNKTKAETIPDLLKGVRAERDKLFRKLMDKGIKSPAYHPKMELMEQRIEVLEYLCYEEEAVLTLDELRSMLTTMFTDSVEETDLVLLTTIHKSKGLENSRVFFLLPELIPSRFATMEWQLEQEQNLKYVGITRAKKELIYISSETFVNDMKRRLRTFNY